MRNVLLLALVAATTAARADEGPKKVDVAAIKDKLLVLDDGKGHLVAIVPFTFDDDTFFYSGDGKTFHSVPRVGGGSQGDTQFETVFADPRYYIGFHNQSSIELKDGKYTVTCGPRTTELKKVDDARKKQVLDGASFAASPRKWAAYALARDQKGVYYYVDHGRNPATEKDFRLFAGPKGALKQLKMTNIVSDSEGDIFSTKTGSLRLILSKQESTWIAHKRPLKLTLVPVEDNVAMIYNDLGVYSGERMGTPCDDL